VFVVRRTVPILLLAAALAGCGSHRSATETTPPPAPTATTTPTPNPTTTQEATSAFHVYFLRDGKVAPVARTVSGTGVAVAALRALAAGPTDDERAQGLTTQLTSGNAVTGVSIDSGVATVTLNEDLSHAALAQLVYTLTQFPTVQAVRTSRMISGAPSLTRATFEDVTPQILVESPLPNETVTSPLRVRGTANTFEATFDLELQDASGRTIVKRFVTATSGSGTRGTYDTQLAFPTSSGRLTLVAYEPSAENGKPLHVVRIPLDGS